jgi:hypothetical protein
MKAVLYLNVYFNRLVDLRCRRVDSWGISIEARPRRSDSDEEARKMPLGARSAWRGNQRQNLTEPKENKDARTIEKAIVHTSL